MKAGHEVDDDVVDEEPNSRKWHVGEKVGQREGRTAIHAVARLETIIDQKTEK